jgi:HEAT repeat protein
LRNSRMYKSAFKLGLISLLAACAGTSATQVSKPKPILIMFYDTAALEQLMQLEDTRTFDAEAFGRLAATPNAIVRERAMIALGRIRDPGVEPLLLRGLADSVGVVRIAAAFALGEDSIASAAESLGVLSRTTGEAAAEALHALGKITTPAARVFVEEALRTRKTGRELHEALLAIWRFPRLPMTTTLVAPFTTSKDPEIRWRAVYALTRGSPDPANIALFQNMLRDADPLVRSFAARGLRAATADTAGKKDVAAASLLAALSDVDAHVRINAVSVLGGYRDSKHASNVVPLLKDSDLNARIAAAQALGLMKGADAANALEARVRDQTERASIRGIAFGSLVAADPVRGLSIANELKQTSDLTLRIYVARGLGGLRTAESLALLRSLATDPDPRAT